MDRLIIKGKADLKGSIKIKGSKNSALPIMVSALLSKNTLKLKNLPRLDDIHNMSKLLRSYGAMIKSKKDTLEIKCRNIINIDADYDIVRKMRASILILGPLIARFGKARISLPGGCAIGTRPIDIHLNDLVDEMKIFRVNPGIYLNFDNALSLCDKDEVKIFLDNYLNNFEFIDGNSSCCCWFNCLFYVRLWRPVRRSSIALHSNCNDYSSNNYYFSNCNFVVSRDF